MNNTRFATLIHMLVLLVKNTEQWISSDWIAGSIGINPVIVRKELALLHEQGWVESKKGKDGGTKLIVSSRDISLADIYQLVKKSNVLGKKNSVPNPACPVGKDINNELDALFVETDGIVIRSLQQRSLESFVNKFD